MEVTTFGHISWHCSLQGLREQLSKPMSVQTHSAFNCPYSSWTRVWFASKIYYNELQLKSISSNFIGWICLQAHFYLAWLCLWTGPLGLSNALGMVSRTPCLHRPDTAPREAHTCTYPYGTVRLGTGVARYGARPRPYIQAGPAGYSRRELHNWCRQVQGRLQTTLHKDFNTRSCITSNDT